MKILALAAVLGGIFAGSLGFAVTGTASAVTPEKPLPRVVIYVESQDLCYDSIATPQNLPPHGPFQTLEADSDNHCGGPALKTEFGPGDRGYVGGRWITTMPDGTVVRFMCPLLGPPSLFCSNVAPIATRGRCAEDEP